MAESSVWRAVFIPFLAVLVASFVTGCWDLKPVESLSIYMVLGIDKHADDLGYLFSVSQSLFSSPKAADTKTSTAHAAGISEALHLLQVGETKRGVPGKILLYAFGEQLLESGEAVDMARSIYSRPDFSLTAAVTATKGSAADLLALNPPESPEVGVFVWGMLDAAQNEGLIPWVTLTDVARQRPVNRDLWLPLVKPVPETDSAMLAGSVVFSRNYPVLELTPAETCDLVMLQGVSQGHAFQIGTPALYSSITMAKLLHSGLDTTITTDDAGVQTIHVRLRTRLGISTPFDTGPGTLERLAELKTHIEEELRGRTTDLLQKLQALDADPLGLTAPGALDGPEQSARQRELYPESLLEVSVTAKITTYGGE